MGRTLSYATEVAGVADVAHEVKKKDRVYAACRKRCEEAWLIVVLGGGPSSFEDADDAVPAHRFRTVFDRVVLLCPASRRGRRVVDLWVAA